MASTSFEYCSGLKSYPMENCYFVFSLIFFKFLETSCNKVRMLRTDFNPSFIYSWSIRHIFEHNSSVWTVLEAKGEKKLSISEQLLRVFFSTFHGQIFFDFFFFSKYCSVHTKKLHYFLFEFCSNFFWLKIGYH